MARNGQWSSVGHVSSIEGRSTWDVLDMQMNCDKQRLSSWKQHVHRLVLTWHCSVKLCQQGD